jgi:hypothetical protein
MDPFTIDELVGLPADVIVGDTVHSPVQDVLAAAVSLGRISEEQAKQARVEMGMEIA